MQRFLLKCALYSLPVIALFVFPFLVFFLTGELLSPKTVVGRQNESSDEILYQSAFTSVTEKAYKALAAIERNPEVMALGKSRVLTFRSDFFKDPKIFYNAGRGVHNSFDLSAYLDVMPVDGRLNLIFFDLSGFLKDETLEDESGYDADSYNMVSIFLTSGWRQAYLYYLEGKFSVHDIFRKSDGSKNIGLGALVLGEGFRVDGSLNRGGPETISRLKDQLEIDLTALSAAGADWNGSFEYDSSISNENLLNIEKFLYQAEKRNIYIIGYLSPYAREIYKKMQARDDVYGVSFKLATETIIPLFKKYGYSFYDLRDIEIIGSSDAELYDLTHITERGSLRLLRYIALREPKLAAYVDIYSLGQKIKAEPL